MYVAGMTAGCHGNMFIIKKKRLGALIYDEDCVSVCVCEEVAYLPLLIWRGE